METICRQYKKAVARLPNYEADFEKLSEAAGDANVKKWSKEASRAQRKRKDKIDEMDIFMAKDQTCI